MVNPRRSIGTIAAGLLACTLVTPALGPSASAAVPPQVRWSDRDVVTGATVKAVVEKSSRPTGATLVLQRKHLDGWRTADRTAQETKRGYVLHAPTDQLGSFRFRVVATNGTGKMVSASSGSSVTVRPPYDPKGLRKQHVFASRPRVRWDSCRRIRWTFNPDAAPERGLRQLREGFRRMHLATGLDFAYVGRTKQTANPYGTDVDGADLIIGWRTARSYQPFARHPGTVGMGGNTFHSGYQEADGTGVNMAVRGGVVLNASMKGRLSNGFGKGLTWGEVIIHELGHVIGLDHPAADSQIMYHSVLRRDADWGAGDLAGFRRLGDVRGCLEKAPGRVRHLSGRFVRR